MHQIPRLHHGDAVRRTQQTEQTLETMIAEIRDNLARRPLPELPCKYFYDDRGCALFEEITRLPEYYPARTETGILAEHADSIVEAVAPCELVELGAGTSRKIRFFLDAVRYRGWLEASSSSRSEAALAASVARLHDYPEARVTVVGTSRATLRRSDRAAAADAVPGGDDRQPAPGELRPSSGT
jgi:uncharacterized SAM-dependent methyltransferase